MDNQQDIDAPPQPDQNTVINQSPQPKRQGKKKKIILITALVILVFAAFGGLYYCQNSKYQDLQKELDETKAQLEAKPAVEEETPVTKAPVEPNYTGWTQVTDETLNPNQTALYKNGTATLAVYSKDPMMNLSSNSAEGGCVLQGDAWTPETCSSSITKSTVSEMSAYVAYGGALGRTKYLVAVESSNQWFVFSDYIDHDPSKISDSEAEIDQHKAQLADTLEQLVDKTLPQS